MSAEFDRKANVLAGCYTWIKDEERGKEFILDNDLGLYSAVLYAWGYIPKMSNDAKEFVEEAYFQMLLGLDLQESDYQNYGDVYIAWDEKQKAANA